MLCPRYIDNKYRQVKCIFSPSATFFCCCSASKQISILFTFHGILLLLHDASENKNENYDFFSALILLVVHLLVIVNSWHGKQSVVKKIVWVKKMETQTRGKWMNFFLRNWGSFKFFMSWVTFVSVQKVLEGWGCWLNA